MVVQPNATLFNEMLRLVTVLPSYTGGDQGFLAELFPGFANSPLFDPSAAATTSPAPPCSGSGAAAAAAAAAGRFTRLPTGYNADLGLYLLNKYRWVFEDAGFRAKKLNADLGLHLLNKFRWVVRVFENLKTLTLAWAPPAQQVPVDG